MFTLLQRMDDSEPRLPAGGDPMHRMRVPTTLTVLADPEETEDQALEDWARGLDWVQWLLSGVRRRCTRLHFASSGAVLQHDWEAFASGALRQRLMPAFMRSWQAVQQLDLERLLLEDGTLAGAMKEDEAAASLKAGQLLLKATRNARYQGLLGRFRRAQELSETPGHFLTTWAAVAQFFQVSLVSATAEYLRLEWALATQHLPGSVELRNLPQLTGSLLKEHPHAAMRALS